MSNRSSISFCEYGSGASKRASIRHNCNQGWNEITKLYGLNDTISMNTIKVNHFYYQPNDATSRLSLNENYNVSNYTLSNQIPHIYLPGIKIVTLCLVSLFYLTLEIPDIFSSRTTKGVN